jgi:hypothetical protein
VLGERSSLDEGGERDRDQSQENDRRDPLRRRPAPPISQKVLHVPHDSNVLWDAFKNVEWGADVTRFTPNGEIS